MIRRFGETPDPSQHYKIRQGAYAILERNNQLLLTYQALPLPELQLPGGGIDEGESHIRALHREVLEETGWVISQARRLGAYRRFTYMPEYEMWAEKVCSIYLAYPVRQLSLPTEDGHTPIWASTEFAASNLENSGDRHFVRNLWGLV